MNRTWIILGATSSMARAFVRLAAADGALVLLGGRDMAELEALAADCQLRGARGALAGGGGAVFGSGGGTSFHMMDSCEVGRGDSVSAAVARAVVRNYY